MAPRQILFSVHCADTRLGFHVRVAGSVGALGAWTPQNALPMLTCATEFPKWSAAIITVEDSDDIEYKYIICDSAGRIVRWEERPNRAVDFASSASLLSDDAVMMVSEVFNSCTDGHLDTVVEGTVIVGRRQVSAASNLSDEDKEGDSDLFAPTIRERHSSWSTLNQSCGPGSLLPLKRNSHSWLAIASTKTESEPEDLDASASHGRIPHEAVASSWGMDTDASANTQHSPRNFAREESSSNLFAAEIGQIAEEEHVERTPATSSSEFEDRYSLVGNGPLGEGTFGLVWRCIPRKANEIDGIVHERAAKMVKKARLSARDMRHLLGDEGEVRTHMAMDHPHIVRLYEYFDEPASVTLVLEWCRGGDLFDAIVSHAETARLEQANSGLVMRKGLPESAAAIAMQHLLSALAYVHSVKVVHRDIKCENVLLAYVDVPVERNIFKLCDFGFAACDTGDGLDERLGSPDTVAPEVLQGLRYGAPTDVWSAGVLLYMMISATPPFYAPTDGEVLRRVRFGNYSMNDMLWDTISVPCKDLIQSLMTVLVANRPSSEEALRMPWLASRGLTQIV